MIEDLSRRPSVPLILGQIPTELKDQSLRRIDLWIFEQLWPCRSSMESGADGSLSLASLVPAQFK